MSKLGTFLAVTGAFSFAAPAFAANVDVLMLNKGAAGNAVFEPALVEIAVGDTVTFVLKDRWHNVGTIKGMLPVGATPFQSKINEQPFVVTFTVPGAYAINCPPHYNMGMVGIIVVGHAPDNLDAIRAAATQPPTPFTARGRFEAIFAELDAR